MVTRAGHQMFFATGNPPGNIGDPPGNIGDPPGNMQAGQKRDLAQQAQGSGRVPQAGRGGF